MNVYLMANRPLALVSLLPGWRQLFGPPRSDEDTETWERLITAAEPCREAADPAWWQAECDALRELLRMPPPASARITVAPLTVPVKLPVHWAPLLEGWRIGAWSDGEDMLSPLALLWLKAQGAASGSPPCGDVRQVMAENRISLLVLGGHEQLPVTSEAREHGEEHIDEGMLMLECNLDDASPEWVAHALERLLQAGANDVSAVPVTMKKGRSGVKLQVLCYRSVAEALKELLFRETTTFGVRWYPVTVHRLARRFVRVQTRWGEVTVKAGYYRGERVQLSPEYADCARLAAEHGVPLPDVFREAWRAAEPITPARL